MAQPDTPSTRGPLPDDDLDKQVEDMLETIEAGSDALFDAVNEASADSTELAFEELGESIAQAEGETPEDLPVPRPIDDAPAGEYVDVPVDTSRVGEEAVAAIEPDDAEFDPVDETVAGPGSSAHDVATTLEDAVEDAVEDAAEALDEVAGDPDGSMDASMSAHDIECDPELDRAIADAVADAEDAMEDELFDPPAPGIAPIDLDDEEIGVAIEREVARELASQTGELDAINESMASEPETGAEDASEEPAAVNSGADMPAPEPVVAGANISAPDPSVESAASDAAVEVKTRPWERLVPLARGVWSKAGPLSAKVGSAAVHAMSRPLVMLDPSVRDYLGYAAAVTAFMGVCVWVFSLI